MNQTVYGNVSLTSSYKWLVASVRKSRIKIFTITMTKSYVDIICFNPPSKLLFFIVMPIVF